MLACRWRYAAITAAALLAPASHACAEGPVAKPEQAGFSAESRLDRYMRSEVDANQIAGAVVLIRRNGQTLLQEPRPARSRRQGGDDDNSIFRIYSTSKPITTVAAMMLVEEGRLRLDDPLSKYIPAFANLKVGVEVKAEDGPLRHLALVPAKRPMIAVPDLIRHTFRADSRLIRRGLVKKAYVDADLFAGDVDNAKFVERLAKLPRAYQPGMSWDYSHSTGVLGRVIEVVSASRSTSSSRSGCSNCSG